MKIDFYNRQRRYCLDLDEFASDAQTLTGLLSKELLHKPARTLPVPLSTPLIEQIIKDSQISVILLSNRAIRVLNRDFRQIDRPTDVLMTQHLTGVRAVPVRSLVLH